MFNKSKTKWFCFLFVAAVVFWVLSGGSVIAASIDETQALNLPEYTQPGMDEPPSIAGLLLKIGLGLVAIVVLSYFLVQVFTKRLNTAKGTWIRILDYTPIGTNRGIYLVDVGGRILVIGMTDHNMVRLMEIEDENLITEMLLRPENVEVAVSPRLPKWLNRYRISTLFFRDQKKQQPTEQPSFHHKMEEQLNRMWDMSKDDKHE